MDEKLSNAPALAEEAVALPVIDRLMRVSRQAELRFGRTCSRFGLQAWEFDVLTTLRVQAPPHELCPGTIADRLLVSNSTMTNRVNRLEKAGLVERRLSPENRRIVIIRLTDQGRGVVDQVIAARQQTEREVLGGGLSEEESGRLSELLDKLDTALVSHDA